MRFGIALGSGIEFDSCVTVEGVATSKAVVQLAQTLAVEMPIAQMISALIDKKIPLGEAIRSLMSRPLKQE